jgi:hypothetical protein
VARTRDWRGKLGFRNERERERERQTCERGKAEEDSELFFDLISFSTCGSA